MIKSYFHQIIDPINRHEKKITPFDLFEAENQEKFMKDRAN
jgi:hypothetical protein